MNGVIVNTELVQLEGLLRFLFERGELDSLDLPSVELDDDLAVDVDPTDDARLVVVTEDLVSALTSLEMDDFPHLG